MTPSDDRSKGARPERLLAPGRTVGVAAVLCLLLGVLPAASQSSAMHCRPPDISTIHALGCAPHAGYAALSFHFNRSLAG